MEVGFEGTSLESIYERLSEGFGSREGFGILKGEVSGEGVVIKDICFVEGLSQILVIYIPDFVKNLNGEIDGAVGCVSYTGNNRAYDSLGSIKFRGLLSERGVPNLGLCMNLRGEYHWSDETQLFCFDYERKVKRLVV